MEGVSTSGWLLGEIGRSLYEYSETDYDKLREKLAENMNIILKGNIPESFPREISSMAYDPFIHLTRMMSKAKTKEEQMKYDKLLTDEIWRLDRNSFILQYSFPVISMDWVSLLKEFIIKDSPCIEIAAGSGALSYALKSIGTNIISTSDTFEWVEEKGNNVRKWAWKNRPYFKDLERMTGVEAIEKYGKDVEFVIISWAVMDDSCMEDLLKMREVNPNAKMIFIGEFGDCCASEGFCEIAEDVPEYDTALNLVNSRFISWFGIHDRVYVVK